MATIETSRPETAEYASFYGKYIDLVTEADVVAALEEQRGELTAFLGGVSEEESGVRHPPYTWSIKEVIGHVIDGERVFGYRALRFAREDATALPGFDENAYVRSASFDARRLSDLTAEWDALRRSHFYFFRALSAAAWRRIGVANNNPVSVRALAYILVGHARHHAVILRKRLGREAG